MCLVFCFVVNFDFVNEYCVILIKNHWCLIMMFDDYIYINLEKLYLHSRILQYVSQGLLSTWKKWTREEGPGGRISGSVCGLDPKYVKLRIYINALGDIYYLWINHHNVRLIRFCEAPASVAPYEWPDDITKWPICRKTRGITGMTTKDKTAEHMVQIL